MVHTAYDSLQLLTNLPNKIDSISSYGPNLLISSSDRSFQIYAPQSSTSSPSDHLQKEPYILFGEIRRDSDDDGG
ncbi:Vam6/Vps39-like protein [Tanacetum coccineum]